MMKTFPLQIFRTMVKRWLDDFFSKKYSRPFLFFFSTFYQKKFVGPDREANAKSFQVDEEEESWSEEERKKENIKHKD